MFEISLLNYKEILVNEVRHKVALAECCKSGSLHQLPLD